MDQATQLNRCILIEVITSILYAAFSLTSKNGAMQRWHLCMTVMTKNILIAFVLVRFPLL